MTAEEAKSLCDRAMNLPAVVDIRVETPYAVFPERVRWLESRSDPPAHTERDCARERSLGDEIRSMDPNYAPPISSPTRDGGRLRKNEFRRTDVQMNRRKGAAK